MRKFFLIVIVLAVIQNWTNITNGFKSTPDYTAIGEPQVVMYGTKSCGFCARARALFDSKGISYYEYDINNSTEGRRQYNLLNGRGVPLMVINKTVVRGFNKKKIFEALQEF